MKMKWKGAAQKNFGYFLYMYNKLYIIQYTMWKELLKIPIGFNSQCQMLLQYVNSWNFSHVQIKWLHKFNERCSIRLVSCNYTMYNDTIHYTIYCVHCTLYNLYTILYIVLCLVHCRYLVSIVFEWKSL